MDLDILLTSDFSPLLLLFIVLALVLNSNEQYDLSIMFM